MAKQKAHLGRAIPRKRRFNCLLAKWEKCSTFVDTLDLLQVDLTSLASGESEARSADRATRSREFSSHVILNPTKDFLESLETREGKRKRRSPRYSCVSLAKRARKRLHVLHRRENDVQKGAYSLRN